MTNKHATLTPAVGPQDHAQGDGDAPVTLVEYGDYECPYCGQAYPIVKRLQMQLGDRLRLVFRNFPLTEAHPHAGAAAQMAEAAALQGKFWEMHDALYEHQSALGNADLLKYARALDLNMDKLDSDLRNKGVAERVRADFAHGVRSGVNGTPTFFINGQRFDGNWSDEREFVAALVAAAGS